MDNENNNVTGTPPYQENTGGQGTMRTTGGGQGSPPNIPNYLVHAILVTIFCCLPLGIAAIVFSSQVNSKLAAGDIEGATESSNKARLFSWISLGAGILWVLLWVILAIAGALPFFISEMY